MKNKNFLILLLLIALSALAYLTYQVIEYYEEEVDQGWGEEARRNPFLAAEQYLQQLGLLVESSGDLTVFKELPINGTLVLTDANLIQTQEQADQLTDWLDGGGHIIAAVNYNSANDVGSLLSSFYIEQYDANEFQGEEGDLEEVETTVEQKASELLREYNELLDLDEEEKEEIIPDDQITFLEFEDIKEQLRIHFNNSTLLYHESFYEYEDEYEGYEEIVVDPEPFYWAGDEQGTRLMQFAIGEGMLTVLSGSEIWQSDNVQRFDHAYLLWVLSRYSDKIVFIYGVQMPSLFQLLWKYAAEFIIAVSILLLFWLLYKTKRFGPVKEVVFNVRRSVAEHLQMESEFLWEQQQASELLAAVRSDVFQKMQAKYPKFRQLSELDQLQLIKAHHIPDDRLKDETLTQVLYGDIQYSENDFYQKIHILQEIRETL